MIDIFGTTLNNIEHLNAIDDTLVENPDQTFNIQDLKFNLQSKGVDISSFYNLDIFNTDIIDRNSFDTKMEELNSMEISKPKVSSEGIFGLAKRIGSKLNYNESDIEIADYFASIESGGNYNARNTRSSAFGKYQVIKSTLAEKAKDLGLSIKEAKTPEGQEMIMHSLISDYKSRLKKFDLPITKENMFILHNLGQTGGVRVLKGTYTSEDIKAMRANVSSDERNLPPKELVKAYTERYNINIPIKQES